MKILFDLATPFLLAHGGVQVQIEQTKRALEESGVEVEWLRRWDAEQQGDVIHYFGVPHQGYQNMAHRRGLRVVHTVLFSETCNRPEWKLTLQKWATRLLLAVPFGESVKNQLVWKSYPNSDCNIVGLNAEKNVLRKVYGVPDKQVGIVPLGCEEDFLNASPSTREGDYLVSVATVSAQKQSVKLARMAMAAEVPILFVGKPYSETEPHWQEFCSLVASSPYVRHRQHLGNREELIALIRGARGFVLFSQYENWSLAADEAVACGLPLLLPELPWSRERFANTIRYLSLDDPAENVRVLRRFYDDCPRMSPPPRPRSWREAVEPLIAIYRAVLAA